MQFRLVLMGVFALPLVAGAAILTQVPMQGGMVMPMINYDSSSGMLSVMMPADVPQLTPLLISNPSDSFDPASPWFTDLDTSAMGLSFSRRYGFVMDNDSDNPSIDNKSIWLRKVSGSAGLSAYRYSATPSPGIWEPVFGTGGSSNALAWNMMMFHPAFAAPPGTNGYTATFEAYLVDNATGLEIPGSSTMPMVFQFTNMPDGRPDLGLGISFAITWDPAITNYGVEYASSLSSTNWTLATNTPVEVDGQSVILMPVDDAVGKFFRMRHLP